MVSGPRSSVLRVPLPNRGSNPRTRAHIKIRMAYPIPRFPDSSWGHSAGHPGQDGSVRRVSYYNRSCGRGWRKSCGLLLGEEVSYDSDSLADICPAAGVTALAARWRFASGPSRSARAVVGSWVVGARALAYRRLLSSDGAPVVACPSGRWPDGAAGPSEARHEAARGSSRFRHEPPGVRDYPSPGVD